MSVDIRYRKCNCGADMSISVVRDSDSGELTGVVWNNVYPSRALGRQVKAAFKNDDWRNALYVSGTVYCQLCDNMRKIHTFRR